MKAIVMYDKGGMPQYTEDFPEPVVQNENEVLLTMRASAVKHIDKSRASGKHYSTQGDVSNARIVGGDGVGVLTDGTRAFAFGMNGMMAEKVIVDRNSIIPIPEGLDDSVAAALPNAVAGSAMALLFRAKIKEGDTVLINGATGFTGKVAVQVARYYGAKKIIATGRNQQSLEELKLLGADEIVSLKQDDTDFIARIKEIHQSRPIDIILDYLWGHLAEMLLEVLKGKGMFTPKTKFVTIGSMAGDKIQLSAEILRSVDLELSGSGLGSWTQAEMQELITSIIPEMFQLALDNKLKVDTIDIAMNNIGKLWDMKMTDGKRVVVKIA
ncbi:quinone oxidoreductase family protein [Emticicia fontis]